MGKKAQISLSQLKKAAGPEVKRLLAEVAEAINEAPDGAVIDGSEEAVREAYRLLVEEHDRLADE